MLGRAGEARGGGRGGRRRRGRGQCAPAPVRHSTSARPRNNTTIIIRPLFKSVRHHNCPVYCQASKGCAKSVIEGRIARFARVSPSAYLHSVVSLCCCAIVSAVLLGGSSNRLRASSHFRGCLAEIRWHLDRVILPQYHVSCKNVIKVPVK